MQFEASVSPYEQADVHALAVAVFKDEKIDGFLQKLDELSGGLVKSAIDAKEFLGKEGETAYFHLVRNSKLKAQRLLLVGVGDAGEYKSPPFRIWQERLFELCELRMQKRLRSFHAATVTRRKLQNRLWRAP